MPKDLRRKNIIGAGLLAGIGFTMSIFITLLAYGNKDFVNNSKIAILIASILAGTIGFIVLKFTLKPPVENDEKHSLQNETPVYNSALPL